MPIEHKPAVPSYPGDPKWEPEAWYGDEQILPEWAREEVRKKQRKLKELDRNPLVDEFQAEFEEMQRIMSDVNPENREQKKFGAWSIKDVLAHLTGWAKHDIACLKSLTGDKVAYWDNSIDRMNKTFIKKRRKRTWEVVYVEFVNTTNDLIEMYESLPEDLWNVKIWTDKDNTPISFIEGDIQHYRDHLREIDKLV